MNDELSSINLYVRKTYVYFVYLNGLICQSNEKRINMKKQKGMEKRILAYITEESTEISGP